MKAYKRIFASIALAAALTSCSVPESPAQSRAAEQSGTAREITVSETAVPETEPPETAPAETTVPQPIIDPRRCAASLERLAVSDANKFLSSPADFEIDEENSTLSLDVTYEKYIDIYTLQNAFLDIEVTDGRIIFDSGCLNPDGSVNLTKAERCLVEDGEGICKEYAFAVTRQVCELPIVNICLGGENTVNDIKFFAYTEMEMYIDDTGAPEYSGTVPMTGQIKGRGHSSWHWAKKPYRIKLDFSAPILGLHKNRDWILLANYADKSLIRNTLAYEMGKCLTNLDWTPTQIPVDLFVNGEYRGVYSIGEHMETANGRVEIDENSEDADTGYLLEIGGADDDSMEEGIDFFHTPSDNINFAVYKAPDNITDEQRQYIKDYVCAADRAIMAGEGYEEYIDVDSFCDWFIIHELTRNVDSIFRRSCFMTKDKGGKLKMGPIWDFDLAFGNFIIDYHPYQRWVTIGSDAEDAFVWVSWGNYLMNNEKFRERLRQRWFEVRDDLMDTAMACIGYYAEKIDKSQEENYKLWQVWDIDTGFSPEQNIAANTYELQIQYLKDYLTTRAAWIDENI